MTLEEAASQGIQRVRLETWINPEDYFKITIFKESIGPWISLYSPINELIGQKNPQVLFIGIFDFKEGNNKFMEYKGPVSKDEI